MRNETELTNNMTICLKMCIIDAPDSFFFAFLSLIFISIVILFQLFAHRVVQRYETVTLRHKYCFIYI